MHLVQVKNCMSFILWMRWSSNFDIAKGPENLRIEYFAKALHINNKSLLTTVDPKVKQGSSLGVLYVTYQQCHFEFSAPFAFSMYENAVVRDGFTRENCCSFGLCPNEGGGLPNFFGAFS